MGTREPIVNKPDDIDPRFDWERGIPSPGHSAVDFEERVDFRRLHRYRLARARRALAERLAARLHEHHGGNMIHPEVYLERLAEGRHYDT